MAGPRPPTVGDLHAPLLAWYDERKRDLPWRDVDDPYAVWVSEVMLQQTRVETVIPYFTRWMAAFPTIRDLARAEQDDVLSLWSGLGYYSRARNLHKAAKLVDQEHGGLLPDTARELVTLPGIGPYTAGAIASIAYQEAVPAVDGNVLRVIARLDADDRDVLHPATRTAFTARAEALVPTERAGDWNQAVMELGATVCTPTSPNCPDCPVQAHCLAHQRGRTHQLPVRSKRTKPEPTERHFLYLRQDDHVLFEPGPDTGLLAGLLTLPAGDTQQAAVARTEALIGTALHAPERLGHAEHRFTHRLWHMQVHTAEPHGTVDTSHPDARWVHRDELPDAPISNALRKALAVALAPTATH